MFLDRGKAVFSLAAKGWSSVRSAALAFLAFGCFPWGAVGESSEDEVGDSTLRGLMYALLEHVNHSLETWRQSHDILVFQRDLHGGRYMTVEDDELAVRPVIAFAYFPLFWQTNPSRLNLTKAVTGLFNQLNLPRGAEVTLVVGGAQWITLKHLMQIDQLRGLTG
ncbi:hypothetical protein AAHC03_019443 [Spirometra sp. Aus1]